MTTVPISADGSAIALACTALVTTGDGSVKPLTATDWTGLSSSLATAEMRPRDLIGMDGETIAARLGLAAEPAQRLASLMSRGGQLGLEVERLAGLGIWIVTQADEAYPENLKKRLGRTAPPVLFGSGPRGVLGERGIGVVGSRDADEEALAYASKLGGLCAEQGFTIVSGAARGIDITAMLGCVERGGQAIGITVDPLERLIRRADLRAAIADELLTLATPFLPGTRWFQGNAMRRNRLIYAAAEAAVVVTTAAGSGGTWAGAVENLKADWVPLHVREVESEGNRLLIAEGGLPLTADLEGLSVEALLQPRQESLLTPLPAVQPAEAPASAFEAVWPLFVLVLDRPRKEKEVADLLELQPTQARAWLAQGVELGLLEVGKRPKLYSLTGKSKDAAQLHLNA